MQPSTENDETGVLFETGSGKYLKLIPSNAQFHSSIDNATLIPKSQFDDIGERRRLLDHHNVDWYFSTIEFRPHQPELDATPSP